MKNPSDDRTLQKVRHPQEIYRTLLLIGGTAYLFWWVLVECFLPGSFNPMGSRLGAVSYFWLLCGSSFFVPYLFKNLENLSPTAIWVATAHYFYLLHHNLNDINWLIGCYITVIAGCACLQKIRDLLIYSGWVIFFFWNFIDSKAAQLHSFFSRYPYDFGFCLCEFKI